MNTKLILTITLLSGLFLACSTSSNSGDESLTLELTGVEPLQNGFHFEGWVIIDGSPVTTGKFNVDDNGNLITLGGSVIPNATFEVDADLSAATTFILTIEPSGDTDDIPAETHHLAGDITNGSSTLSFAHSASLGDNFSSASGAYILATPSDDDDSNENSGIWFLDPSGPSAGLSLPILPAGWRYEGWAVSGGTPISTGVFTSVSEADTFSGFSGTNSTPPFPGEDFLMNAPSGLTFPLNLAGGAAVISIEPYPDDSPAPYTLKPLVGQIPGDATDRTLYSTENNSNSFSSGTVTIN
ncbi:MAG: hypothetical protein JJ971_11455 [Balneolaceae bacterium]|nr:hypothetical protein [Balneolaceae bacterium]MBO6546134.1 hypothetical protein [Balneolaceae bacterium]MBO6648492.1 hypothetical protein [Balneolaceae bacterium]